MWQLQWTLGPDKLSSLVCFNGMDKLLLKWEMSDYRRNPGLCVQ